MKLLHMPDELVELDRTGRRAVVMTMGALHEGHLALVRRAREVADQVVVTIFVNPLQFNDPGDLERYPRTLEADCALLEREGVDAVFAPPASAMYPDGKPAVTVSPGRVGEAFEGLQRPGHFDGVLTVVAKLLHLTAPDVALFGRKDAQQLIAVRAMVRDLSFPVQIEGVDTVREADGLAMSSRNVHLSAGEREQALVLHRALGAAAEAARNGASVDGVVGAGRALLASATGVTTEYCAALNPADASALEGDYRGEAIIAVAAHVGATRLIDNVAVEIAPAAEGAES